ncbi:MAG TPA: hypothetical protein VKB12_08615 [Pyrinomonadaceae bacterium]|nr:hypothetical protein [Pyrinomonadaceae bacterium]
MNSTKRYHAATALLSAIFVSLILTLSPQRAWAQDDKKKDEAPPQGTPMLWRAPADITTLDLLAGPGGDASKPDLSQVIWEESQAGGYSVKWKVRDAAGKHWVVKLGNEARPETAATRLVWAAGYPTEINYLVPCVKITNAPKPPKDKSVKRCEGKGFANVRFEARPDDAKRLDLWSWKQNPFAGTREFNGLIVLMALVNNWDLKDDNNKVIYSPGEGGEGELRYVISDLGATFGKTGGPITHSRNEPEKYIKTGFVEKVEGNLVRFDYHGKNSGLFDNISTADAKWIGDLLSQLSERQITDAFRAANFDPKEIEGLTYEVRARINALHNLPGGADAMPAAAASPTPGR